MLWEDQKPQQTLAILSRVIFVWHPTWTALYFWSSENWGRCQFGLTWSNSTEKRTLGFFSLDMGLALNAYSNHLLSHCTQMNIQTTGCLQHNPWGQSLRILTDKKTSGNLMLLLDSQYLSGKKIFKGRKDIWRSNQEKNFHKTSEKFCVIAS